MNLQTAKLELIRKITNIQDEELVVLLNGLLDVDNESDWWDELTETQRRSIETAREQLATGKGIPHSEVVTKYRQKYRA